MKDYEPAQIELEEEVKYYNEQQSGLGYDFAREVANTIARILRYPEAWTRLSKKPAGAEQKGSIRSRLSDQGDKILIVAVAHLKRKPWYWRDRVKSI
jgi:hypothetical protein